MAETKEPTQEETDALDRALTILHKLHHDYGRPCEPSWAMICMVASLSCEHNNRKCVPCMTEWVTKLTAECQDEIKKNGLVPVRGLSEPLHDGGILESSLRHRIGNLKN